MTCFITYIFQVSYPFIYYYMTTPIIIQDWGLLCIIIIGTYYNMNQFTNSQFKDSNLIQQQLNQSRFLIEEVNLDDQPTQQEILQRAQQLQIDDLILARESLTKELDPEWKPYCNRHGQIYYINFLQRLAYVDHPIDMMFKKQYAKNNGLRIPVYRSFQLDQVCKSMEIVEQQIRNYKTKSHKTTLRIVYEQPSEQEALSSHHPKSPLNFIDQDGYSEKQRVKQENQQDLNIDQIQQLYEYEKVLEQKYDQLYRNHKAQIQKKMKSKQEEHQNTINKLVQRKIEQICQKYEQDIGRKNKIDYNKQCQKLQIQYQQKRIEYCESIHKFNCIFEQFRNKQRSVENLVKMKNSVERINNIQRIKQKTDLQKQKALLDVRSKMISQFNQKIILINGNSKRYQSNLKDSLDRLFGEIDYLERSNKQKLVHVHQPQFYKNTGLKTRSDLQLQRLVEKQKINRLCIQKNQVEKDLQYEQLKKQIKQLTVWQDQSYNKNNYNIVNQKSFKPSLNLRLRMRII